EEVDLASGEVLPVHPVAVGPLQEGLVDVGDVLDVEHLQAGVPPDPVDQVEGDVGGGVAHVGGVVGGDSADVHARTSVHRLRRHRPVGGGVVDDEGSAALGGRDGRHGVGGPGLRDGPA